jgi:glycosyltransferase involved in cell wall biosynthesis
MSGTQQNSDNRIVHIIAGLNIGGANVMLLKLLSAMDRTKFDSSVIVLMDKGILGTRFEELGIPVYETGMPRGRPTISAFRRITRLLDQLEPDLLQGWMYHGNTAASLSNLFSRKKTPVLWNIRHTPYDLADENRLTRSLISLGARFSKSPQKIVYNSLTSARRHEQMGYDPLRTVIIPNGFDTQTFKPNTEARHGLRESLCFDDQTPLIGMVARFHPMKDHTNFLQAAAILNHDHPDAHYLLVGLDVNAENHELTSRISTLGLTDYVHLLGERRDIDRILPGFDIATLTSAWGEGFPNVIGEAMACGVPCVVTDIGDSAWVVGDTGIAVAPRNPQALANAWMQMLELNPQEREHLGCAARQRIEENFTLPTIVEQYEELYSNVLQ